MRIKVTTEGWNRRKRLDITCKRVPDRAATRKPLAGAEGESARRTEKEVGAKTARGTLRRNNGIDQPTV
jgi:hypothetical protein